MKGAKRLLAGAGLGGALSLAMLSPAWAHVTVHPSTLPAGSSDIELTFRVPDERDNADTVSVQVFFPVNLPLLTVDVLPVPGWNSTVHTQKLSTPVQTDDGPVSQVVSDVTWSATGSGIAPGQYEDFDIAAGAVPDKAIQLVFKALQTYSSGEVVRWIDVPVAGQPRPDFPAPVLTLTATSASAVSASPHASPSRPSSSTTSDAFAIVALALGSLNLVALSLIFVRRRQIRQTS